MPNYTNDLVPTMTSNTAPEGTAFADDETHGGAYQIFNDTDASWWASDTNSVPMNIGYEFSNQKRIEKYTLETVDERSVDRAPRDWEFQGWGGSQWVTLDSRTGISWNLGEKKSFTFSNSTLYTKYRLHITANNGGALHQIEEMEMMETAFSCYHLFENSDNLYYWDGVQMVDTGLTLSGATNDEIETEATTNGIETVDNANLEAFSQYSVITYIDDDTITTSGEITVTPKDDLLLMNSDIAYDNIASTDSITLTASGSPLMIASPDSGSKWYYYDTGSSSWAEITSLQGLTEGANATSTQISDINTNGMSLTDFNALGTEIDDLVSLGGQSTMRFGFLLHDGDSLDNLDVQTDKTGNYQPMIVGTDYTYSLSNGLLEVTINNAPVDSPNEVKINVG